MWLFSWLLLLARPSGAEEWEVPLATRNPRATIYLTELHSPHKTPDERYFDTLRATLAFDLEASGSLQLLAPHISYETKIQWPDVKGSFHSLFWRQENVAYVCAIQVVQNRLELFAFDTMKETCKRYPEVPLTGNLEEDRRQIHRLADLLHKDLCGIEGIATLRILYTKRVQKEGKWLSEIWICDSDGANARRVLTEPGYCLSPGFFPPSVAKDSFFYVSFRDGQSKIYRSKLNLSKGEPMLALRGNQALPSLDRNATQLAFITDIAGRPDLFVQRLNRKGEIVGKARQIYSAPRATQASPTFSPDGKTIAFVSDQDGPPRIYLLDLPLSKETQSLKPRLITTRQRENTSPAWSPDGTKIAYSAKVDGIRQIWIYNLQTQEETPLTFGPENKENPSWAPDSLHLVYNTEGEESCELYLLSLRNPHPLRISKGTGQKRFPCWEMRDLYTERDATFPPQISGKSPFALQ
jgi:TolB protein